MTESFRLVDLLHEKELTIGEESVLSACIGYNEKYYIDRTFNHKIVIRQVILSDKQEGKFADFLATTELEFKQLCQQNPMSNVHWLEKDKSELIWKDSQGNLKILRKYVDVQKYHTYAPSDLDKLLQQAKNHRVMLIADKAGMGKTTVLTQLAKRIKQKFPAHWLVRIDLNNYTELLETQKGKKMDKERVLEFISKEVLKLESDLEKELFKKSFEGSETNKVVVMVDGFDEICPNYKNTVIDMLQVLKQTSLEQLWVTTRPHLREELEDNLQQLSYTLQPFSEVEQVEFLKKFWLQNLKNLEDTNQHQLEIYAEALISKLAQSISDKDKEFAGIPLQTRMLAEAFEEDFRSFCVSGKSESKLPHKLDLLGLYERFIYRKYNIYYKEKSKTEPFNMATKEQQERDFKTIQLEHQLLALEALFTEDQVKFLQMDNNFIFSDEEVARVGIVQRNNDGKPQFIHRTFAEYFVAEFLVKQLTKETKSTQVRNFLLNGVLLKSDYLVIRAFLDGLLEKSLLSQEALKDCGERLDKQLTERETHSPLAGVTTALHEGAREDNARIIGFLLDSLKSGEHSDAIKKMLLAADTWGQTALHMAAERKSIQAIKEIRKWADESHLNLNELKNKLLLATDMFRYTAWLLAAKGGSLEALET